VLHSLLLLQSQQQAQQQKHCRQVSHTGGRFRLFAVEVWGILHACMSLCLLFDAREDSGSGWLAAGSSALATVYRTQLSATIYRLWLRQSAVKQDASVDTCLKRS
jgi:hypothetical protein